MSETDQKLKDWRRQEDALDQKITQFEKAYTHRKPCKRYLETGYCPHIANAQQRRFGKDTLDLVDELISLSGKV
jgi:hypothetical protein